MAKRNPRSKIVGIAMVVSIWAMVALMLAMAGCATSAPPLSEIAAVKRAEVNFSLDHCETIQTNLYKCPAIDKPVCSPYYDGQIDCVRMGPKGSIYVEKAMLSGL